MNFVLPPKSAVGYLDPEIAGEGQQVTLSDGENVSWTPPPQKLVMPDWSQIKSIAKYFGRKGGPVYPAWLFHPTEPDKLVQNAAEAEVLGVCYRKATEDEKARYGHESVWDWKADSKWRPRPQRTRQFDPQNMETGKIYQPAPHNPVGAQERLIESLIPAVAAAVAQSLKATGPAAPASVDKGQWDAFLQFQAWQKTKEAVEVLTANDADDGASETVSAPANALSAMPNKEALIAEASDKGVKVDKRWSLDRIMLEIEKAA